MSGTLVRCAVVAEFTASGPTDFKYTTGVADPPVNYGDRVIRQIFSQKMLLVGHTLQVYQFTSNYNNISRLISEAGIIIYL